MAFNTCIEMSRSLIGCLVIFSFTSPVAAGEPLPYGHADFYPSSDRPAGLAADGSGNFAAATPHVPSERLDGVPIDDESLKRIYDQATIAAGVRVRFDSMLVDVVLGAGGRVELAIIADKSGLRVCRARVSVDATGDADLVARCGVPIHHGDDAGGELMPASMCFTLANVRGFETQALPPLGWATEGEDMPLIRRIRRDSRFSAIPDEHICMAWSGPGCVGFNAGHVFHVDNTDPESISRAMVEGRRLAAVYRDALAAYVPEQFGDCHLVGTGPPTCCPVWSASPVWVANNILGDKPKMEASEDGPARHLRFQYGSNLFSSGNRIFVRSMTDLYCIGDPKQAMVLSEEHR